MHSVLKYIKNNHNYINKYLLSLLFHSYLLTPFILSFQFLPLSNVAWFFVCRGVDCCAKYLSSIHHIPSPCYSLSWGVGLNNFHHWNPCSVFSVGFSLWGQQFVGERRVRLAYFLPSWGCLKQVYFLTESHWSSQGGLLYVTYSQFGFYNLSLHPLFPLGLWVVTTGCGKLWALT